MNKLFSIDELSKSFETTVDHDSSRSAAQCTKFINLHTHRIESIKHLTRIPEPDELSILFTLKSFNAFTFIPYLIKEVGKIDQLTVSTYSINRRIVDSMMRYYEKRDIGSIKIYISDSIKYRLPKVVDHLESCRQGKDIKVFYTWIHAKISLVKIGQQYFSVSGSGNWGENSQYEQYFFMSNPETYEFFKAALYELE